LEPARKVRLPITNPKRSQLTYAKLLKRVDPRSRSPFEWHGKVCRPGSWILESELWPDGTYPRIPLIVEHAGAENPARGWNRRQSDNTVVLWRYDRVKGGFEEVGRVAAPPGRLWAHLLEPLVRDALARDMGESPTPDLDLIRDRLSRFLAAEFDIIPEADRAAVLTLVHDELAGRIAEWMPEREFVGVSPRVV
jgi:hypothetical protein